MRTCHKIVLSILAVIIIILAIVPPIGRSYVEKNSKELIGRQVKIDKLKINYLALSVDIQGFTLYENNAVDTFVSFDQLFINFNLLPLIGGKYSFSEIKLVKPMVNIVQNGSLFNFSDLISSNDSEKVEEPKDTTKKDLRFSVKNIQLQNGEIVYEDKVIDNIINLKNLNLNVPEIAWDSKQSNMGINFRLGEQGDVSISALVDNASSTYNVNLKTASIDLSPFTNYLKSFVDIRELGGYFSSDLTVKGNIEQITDLNVTGSVSLDEFKIIDSYQQAIVGFDSWEVGIKDIDLSQSSFNLSYAVLDSLTSNVVLDKGTSNIAQFIAPLSDTTATGQETVEESINTTPVDSTIVQPTLSWSVDSFVINSASLFFTDNSLNRQFNYKFDKFNLKLLDVTSTASSVPVFFAARLNENGKFSGEGTFNMVDFLDIDFKANLSNLDLLSFSPYSEYFIASPITQGTFNYDMSFKSTQTSLLNNNQVKISGLEFGDRTSDTTATKLPLRLALYVIKDRDNNITIDLPVEGDPSSPQFSFTKVLWKTVVNFITKAATEPFNMLGNLVGVSPDKIKTIPYSYLQDSLSIEQREILDKIAEIAINKSDLKFVIVQYVNIEAEKAAMNEVDTTTAEAKLNTLIENRNAAILNYLLIDKGLSEEIIEVRSADLKNLPEELKKPEFKVDVRL